MFQQDYEVWNSKPETELQLGEERFINLINLVLFSLMSRMSFKKIFEMGTLMSRLSK